MHAPLRLQRSLFRRQRAAIAASLPPPTASFRAYEAAYQRQTRRAGAVLSERELIRRARSADVVYVGDYHTLAEAQESYLRLVRAVSRSSRPVWMALGGVPSTAQPQVDAFLEGRLSETRLRAVLQLEEDDPFGAWPRLDVLLSFARRHALPVVALECEGVGSLARRDDSAARRIASILGRPDAPRVLVLTGQYHVTPEHLPSAVRAHAPGTVGLTVFQNCEAIYWTLLRKGALEDSLVIQTGAEALCWMTATPLACQQSFLDSIDAEEGDRPLRGDAREALFRMARVLGKKTGVAVEAGLRRVQVLTAAEGAPVSRLRHAQALNLREMGQLQTHVLSLESGYFPRAGLIYLARRSVNHAAEEVSHFVRHCKVGNAMVAPRPELDAFYARCLEEALAFLGSRILNPDRQCRTLGEWGHVLEHGSRAEQSAAAYLLAHKQAEFEGAVNSHVLVPPSSSPDFHLTSHALGYLLGDAMSSAQRRGRLRRAELKAMFASRLKEPRRQYLEWVERFDAHGV